MAKYPDLHLIYQWIAESYIRKCTPSWMARREISLSESERRNRLEKANQILTKGLSLVKRKDALCLRMGETAWLSSKLKEAVFWWTQAMIARTSETNSILYLYLAELSSALQLSRTSWFLSLERGTALQDADRSSLLELVMNSNQSDRADASMVLERLAGASTSTTPMVGSNIKSGTRSQILRDASELAANARSPKEARAALLKIATAISSIPHRDKNASSLREVAKNPNDEASLSMCRTLAVHFRDQADMYAMMGL